MGGHGGLNILPQKRWNVYNRDNRLKVAQDEAKAKKQEDEARERHEQAERVHRHQLLLRRSGQVGEEPGSAAGESAAPGAPLEHINFWKEEETKLQHPENEEEQREAAKRRGNPDFYTSDAKFDERFALAYGLTGAKPWYAQAQKAEPREPPAASARAGGAAVLQAAGRDAHGAPTGLLAGGPGSKAAALPGPQPGQPVQPSVRPSSSGRSASTSSHSSYSSSSSDTGSSSNSGSSSSSSRSSSSSSDGEDGHHRRRKRHRSRSHSPSRHRRHSTSRKKRITKHGSKSKRRKRSGGSSSSDEYGAGASKRRRKRHGSKSSSEGRRKVKHRKSASRRRSGGSVALTAPGGGAGGSKSIEQLRAERLLREKDERMKERGLLVSANTLPDGPPQKEYNSAFGFAAALKRRKTT